MGGSVRAAATRVRAPESSSWPSLRAMTAATSSRVVSLQISTGWNRKPRPGAASQRWAPLTSTPKNSTATSSRIEISQSGSAAWRQRSIGVHIMAPAMRIPTPRAPRWATKSGGIE
jgi:hypothetical protein